MSDMKRAARNAVFLAGTVVCGFHPASAQTGTIEFVSRVRPSSGVEEPVRGLPFYLLTKSFQDIRAEADLAEPKPDLDSFIDKISVSPELKAWMKRNHSVSLSGEEFFHSLKPADILAVPELYDAYLLHNAGDESIGFPSPKYRERDRLKDPVKYEKLKADYREAIKKYLAANPQSVDGIDMHLMPIDPSHAWLGLEAKRLPVVRRHALDAAQSRYLVARTETDLDGRGVLRGIPPGRYWLGTLEIAAEIGDTRLAWDTPVTVRPGEVTRIELSSVNALDLHKAPR